MRVCRYDNKTASDQNHAVSRFEMEQTWQGGKSAVDAAIAQGILHVFRGPDGIEFCKRRVLTWGRDQGVKTGVGISKAVYVRGLK